MNTSLRDMDTEQDKTREKEAFGRRNLIKRTPPCKVKREGTPRAKAIRLEISPTKTVTVPPSTDAEILDLTWDDTEGRSTKRRREEGAVKDETVEREHKVSWDMDTARMLKTTISGVIKEVTKLVKLTGDHPNTKVEIKEATASLRTLSNKLANEKVKEIIKMMETTSSMRLQTAPLEVMRKSRSTATQTTNTCIVDCGAQVNLDCSLENRLEIQRRDENLTQDLMTRIVEATDVDEVCELIGKRWPAAVYRVTEVGVGNPLEEAEGDLIIYYGDEEKDKGLKKGFERRFPDLQHIGPDINGEVGAITQITKFQTEEGMVDKGCTIYKVGPQSLKKVNSIMDFIRVLLKFRRRIKSTVLLWPLQVSYHWMMQGKYWRLFFIV